MVGEGIILPVQTQKKKTRPRPRDHPSEKYMAMIGILQEYLQIPDERNLPALWHQWANCTKKQEYNMLTDQLQTYASSPDAFSTNTPVASIKLVQNL